VDSERITLLGKRAHDQYLRLYHEFDICLDPFPFTGCTTTCDALWMGVPVITLAGSTCVFRQGVSLLSHLGFPTLIAATPDAYVQAALNLASDPGRLQEPRRELRNRMRGSLLTDPSRFTRNLETAYRRMWKEF
jgi:protein O-GlcNAc transferase